MAKFSYLYPNAKHLEQIDFEGSFLIKGYENHPCWNCGEETDWIDGEFEAYICSEECERIKWKEFEEAYNGGGIEEDTPFV